MWVGLKRRKRDRRCRGQFVDEQRAPYAAVRLLGLSK